MTTLASIIAQVDEVHVQSLKECDAAYEESVKWLVDTLAANQKNLAAQSCARVARTARRLLARGRWRVGPTRGISPANPFPARPRPRCAATQSASHTPRRTVRSRPRSLFASAAACTLSRRLGDRWDLQGAPTPPPPTPHHLHTHTPHQSTPAARTLAHSADTRVLCAPRLCAQEAQEADEDKENAVSAQPSSNVRALDAVALEPPPSAKRKSSSEGSADGPLAGAVVEGRAPRSRSAAAKPKSPAPHTELPTASSSDTTHTEDAPPQDEEQELDVSRLNVKQLREELKSRDLSIKGLKAELVARLQQAVSAPPAIAASGPSGPLAAAARAPTPRESEIDWAQIAESGLKSKDASPRQHIGAVPEDESQVMAEEAAGTDMPDRAAARAERAEAEAEPPMPSELPPPPPQQQEQPASQSPQQQRAQQARRRQSDLSSGGAEFSHAALAPTHAAAASPRHAEAPPPLPPPAAPVVAAPSELLVGNNATAGGTMRARVAPTTLPLPGGGPQPVLHAPAPPRADSPASKPVAAGKPAGEEPAPLPSPRAAATVAALLPRAAATALSPAQPQQPLAASKPAAISPAQPQSAAKSPPTGTRDPPASSPAVGGATPFSPSVNVGRPMMASAERPSEPVASLERPLESSILGSVAFAVRMIRIRILCGLRSRVSEGIAIVPHSLPAAYCTAFDTLNSYRLLPCDSNAPRTAPTAARFSTGPGSPGGSQGRPESPGVLAREPDLVESEAEVERGLQGDEGDVEMEAAPGAEEQDGADVAMAEEPPPEPDEEPVALSPAAPQPPSPSWREVEMGVERTAPVDAVGLAENTFVVVTYVVTKPHSLNKLGAGAPQAERCGQAGGEARIGFAAWKPTDFNVYGLNNKKSRF
ncbi:hypothetical protein T492DRAFT_840568 [Pavlovales sp. CCMP2436]|nr:hypothetical protein T492DRAFT_840568 [Pavlovales sp. CCMP2436]